MSWLISMKKAITMYHTNSENSVVMRYEMYETQPAFSTMHMFFVQEPSQAPRKSVFNRNNYFYVINYAFNNILMARKGEILGMKAFEIFKISLAEVIGTAILVGMGCLGCLGSFGSPPPSWQGPFSFAFAVLIAIQSIGHISGAHLNPSVTLGAVVLGVIPAYMSIFYVISQIAGAIIGFGLIKAVIPPHMIYAENASSVDFCNTVIHHQLSPAQGLVIEIIVTAILMFMVSGLWDKRNALNSDSTPLRMACGVFVLCVVFAPLTGASMNPARSLAPAIWNNVWRDHWVFWIGPFVGSFLASVTYRMVFSPIEICDKETEAQRL